MTTEQAKAEINQLYMSLSEEKKQALDVLMAIPSADSKTGHWIGIDEEPHEDYECNRCGYICSTFTANIKPSEEYKYCPNCGCRMVEPQETERMV